MSSFLLLLPSKTFCFFVLLTQVCLIHEIFAIIHDHLFHLVEIWVCLVPSLKFSSWLWIILDCLLHKEKSYKFLEIPKLMSQKDWIFGICWHHLKGGHSLETSEEGCDVCRILWVNLVIFIVDMLSNPWPVQYLVDIFLCMQTLVYIAQTFVTAADGYCNFSSTSNTWGACLSTLNLWGH